MPAVPTETPCIPCIVRGGDGREKPGPGTALGQDTAHSAPTKFSIGWDAPMLQDLGNSILRIPGIPGIPSTLCSTPSTLCSTP